MTEEKPLSCPLWHIKETDSTPTEIDLIVHLQFRHDMRLEDAKVIAELLQESIPKSKIEDLIKHYETTKELHFKEQTIFDLKGLLK